MENKDYTNYNFSEDDFVLVQNKERIFDTALSTKPTTFIKDAFKRFCKNKSSVVAAFIIGIIVLVSLIVPVISPYSVKGNIREALLRPKLFEAGTGFWDGTEKIVGVAADPETNLPLDLDNSIVKEAILSSKVYEVDGVLKIDYVYDKYVAIYGEVEKTVATVNLNSYINKGWIKFDLENIDSFELLDDKSPVRGIVSITQNADGKNIYTCLVSQYRELGYDFIPSYLFGTNVKGVDNVKLSFLGLQKSFVFAIVIAAICFTVGLLWGSISGYFGGNVDLFMERFKDILGGVPTVVIVTLMRLNIGTDLWVFALALCITGWMGTASRTRTQFYRFKGREYVLASRTLGASDIRLIFRHILPNALGTIVTSTVLMIPGLIFTEASLSYLGLGLQGSDSFGTILSQNQDYLGTYPALILFPATIISLLMISFNLFGNGLRDALNPSLKGSE